MAPLWNIIERAIERSHYTVRETEDGPIYEGGVAIVAYRLGYSDRRLYHLREQQSCTFDVADKIVCRLHPDGFFAWLNDDDLAPIYETITSKPLTHNRQDLEIEGDEAALAELERRKGYQDRQNAIRSARRAAERGERELLQEQARRQRKYDKKTKLSKEEAEKGRLYLESRKAIDRRQYEKKLARRAAEQAAAAA